VTVELSDEEYARIQAVRERLQPVLADSDPSYQVTNHDMLLQALLRLERRREKLEKKAKKGKKAGASRSAGRSAASARHAGLATSALATRFAHPPDPVSLTE
jgi:hypothetical protein